MGKVKTKSDTSNNRGNQKHLRIIQKISEQHIGKAQHQGTRKNYHTGHCILTFESAIVEVQNVKHEK